MSHHSRYETGLALRTTRAAITTIDRAKIHHARRPFARRVRRALRLAQEAARELKAAIAEEAT